MKSGSVTYFETVRNGQRRLSGETESKEAIASIRRYLYDMRVLVHTWNYVSIILWVKWEDDIDPIDGNGYVNTVFVEIYVLLSDNVTSWGIIDER